MEPPPDKLRSGSSRLGLWDATSIIVGIIVGVGIFKAPSVVFHGAPGPWEVLGVWALGGLVALIGALCFAELATTYPRSGGEYVYLSRAYGSWMGFLFGWAQLAVLRTGNIALLAYVFAEHAYRLWGLPSEMILPFAAAVIVILTLINVLGVHLGKRTQNLLTLAKILGVGGLVVAGFFFANPAIPSEPTASGAPLWFAAAMTYVLFTYSGWHEAAYVAAEVTNPRRNLPWALLLGATIVTVVYVLVNAAYVAALGFSQAATKDGGHRVLALALGEHGGHAFNILVMICALGAINGMIFTSARIFAELGADHRLFASLKEWSPRWQTPVRSLLVQAAISIAMVVGVGLWWRSEEGFDALLESTAGVFWLFFLLTGIALFVLRFKEAHITRPFRVPGYPVVPLLFCACCAYMVVGVVRFAPEKSLIGLAILAVGVPLYFLSQKSLSCACWPTLSRKRPRAPFTAAASSPRPH